MSAAALGSLMSNTEDCYHSRFQTLLLSRFDDSATPEVCSGDAAARDSETASPFADVASQVVIHSAKSDCADMRSCLSTASPEHLVSISLFRSPFQMHQGSALMRQ